jgi:hypothetical protein
MSLPQVIDLEKGTRSGLAPERRQCTLRLTEARGHRLLLKNVAELLLELPTDIRSLHMLAASLARSTAPKIPNLRSPSG